MAYPRYQQKEYTFYRSSLETEKYNLVSWYSWIPVVPAWLDPTDPSHLITSGHYLGRQFVIFSSVVLWPLTLLFLVHKFLTFGCPATHYLLLSPGLSPSPLSHEPTWVQLSTTAVLVHTGTLPPVTPRPHDTLLTSGFCFLCILFPQLIIRWTSSSRDVYCT